MMKPFVLAASILLIAACGNNSAPSADTSSSSGASNGADQAASPPNTGTAVGANWKMIPELSRLTFSSTQTGDAFTGEFKRFSATIELDPNDLPNSHVEVVVDMSSVDAHDEQRNQALPNNEWFGVSQFPTAVFRSDTITKKDDGTYVANGKLTIRDITMDVALPFTLDIDGDTARAFGEVKLMRNDYNVGTGEEWSTGKWVGLDVTVTFDVTATRIGS